jgi:dienelactone hydrolase
VWRSRVNGGRSEQLTHGSANAREVVYSRDGQRLLFETEPSQADIDVALAAEGRIGFLYDARFEPNYDQTPVFPRDAQIISGNGLETHSHSQRIARRTWVYELFGRKQRPATESEEAEFASLTASVQPAGRSGFRGFGGTKGISAASPAGALAWFEARDPERSGHYPVLTLAAQKNQEEAPVFCMAPQCTSQRMRDVWWRNEQEVVFARDDGDNPEDTALYSWRVDESAPQLIMRTSGRFTAAANFEWRCAMARDRLICFFEQPDYPRRLAAIDLQSGAIEILHDPNSHFARFDLGVPPQRLEITTESGVRTYGYLVLPPDYRAGQRLPLVVVTYRCSGFLRGGVGDEYPIFPMAAEGFAVFCYHAATSDYERGARMDTASYIRWTRGPGNPEMTRVQEALNAAIMQLDAMGIVDTDRVGITGLSYGAELTGVALYSTPLRYAAAIVSNSLTLEPTNYYLAGPTIREAFGMLGYGSPEANVERWRSESISGNVERILTPLLINAADREMLWTLHSVTALQDAGRAVEMYVFPDEYHFKWQPAHRLAIYKRNIDWMNFWLRSIESPDAANAAQYERWRNLRRATQSVRDTHADRVADFVKN